MSSSIKAIILALVFSIAQVLPAMGYELSVLSRKEFQRKIHSPKAERADLSKFEINNDELVTLYRLSGKKRMLAKKKSQDILIASIK
ncbi:MAG: hypothetical protein WC635_11535 [Bacteriovorax sp.]